MTGESSVGLLPLDNYLLQCSFAAQHRSDRPHMLPRYNEMVLELRLLSTKAVRHMYNVPCDYGGLLPGNDYVIKRKGLICCHRHIRTRNKIQFYMLNNSFPTATGERNGTS